MSRLHSYNGSEGPGWTLQASFSPKTTASITRHSLKPPGLSKIFSEYFYVCDGFADPGDTESLIEEFERQRVHPVGVSGYSAAGAGETGSYRANSWAVPLSDQIGAGIRSVLQSELRFEPDPDFDEPVFKSASTERFRMPLEVREYRYLGATPFMRFMKYPSGGKHVPHYDASFCHRELHYITLMSWVLFLNTPAGRGGNFQFVDDRQWDLSPLKKDRSDWTRMATNEEIIRSVAPVQGRLLIFPHWLPHQVSLYEAPPEQWRYIIRGDVAYEW